MNSSSSSRMYLTFAFLLLFVQSTYEQDREVHAGSFEVREHSLNRPYPAGLSFISIGISIRKNDLF